MSSHQPVLKNGKRNIHEKDRNDLTIVAEVLLSPMFFLTLSCPFYCNCPKKKNICFVILPDFKLLSDVKQKN